MNVIELKTNEIELLKRIRLYALKDCPNTFSENYDDVISNSPTYWRNILKSITPPNSQKMFLAKEEEKYLGSVFALLDSDNNKFGRLGGMWVDSRYRRSGIGQQLFKSVKKWANILKFEKIKLWVEDSPNGAKEFYKKFGFTETGIKKEIEIKIKKPLCEMEYILKNSI